MFSGGAFTSLPDLTISGNLDLAATSLIRWGTTTSFPLLKRSSAGVQVRLGDDSGYGPFTARGDSTFFITAGSGQVFSVRSSGDAFFTTGEYVTSINAPTGNTLQCCYIRRDQAATATLGVTYGYGRAVAGTQANDTYSPSTAVNSVGHKFLATFSPSASSGSFATVAINPTVNGTSSGTSVALAVAPIHTALTGGTLLIADFGTTSTDYFTGFTSVLKVAAAGVTLAGNYVQSSGTCNVTSTESVSGDVTLDATKVYHHVNTSVARALVLPTAATVGDVHILLDITGSAGANNITVTEQGGGTINGAASHVISTNYAGRSFRKTAASTWIASQ